MLTIVLFIVAFAGGVLVGAYSHKWLGSEARFVSASAEADVKKEI